MVAVTCNNCGTDISKEISVACSQLAELDKRFGTSVQSECIAKVLLADFLKSYSAENKEHDLLCRSCSTISADEKHLQDKIIPFDTTGKERD